MATSVEELLDDAQLREQILKTLDEWDHACAPDLVGLIGRGTTVERVIRMLDTMVDDRVLELVKEPKDPRDYKGPYQKRYKLV